MEEGCHPLIPTSPVASTAEVDVIAEGGGAVEETSPAPEANSISRIQADGEDFDSDR